MLKVIDQYLTLEELKLINEFNNILGLVRHFEPTSDDVQLLNAYRWIMSHQIKKDLTFWPLNELKLTPANYVGENFVKVFLAEFDALPTDVQDFLEAFETITECIQDDVEYRLNLHRLELTQSFIETTFGKYVFGEFYKNAGTFENEVSNAKDDLEVNTSLMEFEVAKVIKLLQKYKS